MVPPAPTRLSTSTFCPHISLSFCATRRAITSVDPPGARPRTNRTGLFGYCWANASHTLQHDDAMSKSDATSLDLITILSIAHFLMNVLNWSVHGIESNCLCEYPRVAEQRSNGRHGALRLPQCSVYSRLF